jgi:hypothetical protein
MATCTELNSPTASADSGTYYHAQERVFNGVLQTRAFGDGGLGDCDTGWVNGNEASCSFTNTFNTLIYIEAKASFFGVKLHYYSANGVLDVTAQGLWWQ